MANINILELRNGVTKTIVLSLEASMIIQEFNAEVDYFATLSTTTKDVAGNAIPKYTIKALSDGAGGGTKDRNGDELAGGKYASLTAAINDYVAMMTEGKKGEPWTAMSFT
jgi:hypothetical protein